MGLVKKTRIDKLIALKYNVSRTKAQTWITQGFVSIANNCITNCDKQVENDLVISISKKAFVKKQKFANIIETKVQQKNSVFVYKSVLRPNTIWILFQNDDIYIINKGNEVLSHGVNTQLNISDIPSSLLHHNYPLYGGASYRKGVVHRLDKNTTGLMILTKNKLAYEIFSNMFKNKKVRRIYIALTHNKINSQEFIIKGKIGHKYHQQKMGILDSGKDTETRFTKLIDLASNKQIFSILGCQLKTGRTHQIRVHLSSINKHIVGDKKYSNTKFQNNLNICLHSSFLEFTYKAKLFKFISYPDFSDALKYFQIQNIKKINNVIENYLLSLI